MSFPVETLLADTMDTVRAGRLAGLCKRNGIANAIDLAMLDASMMSQLVGDEADELLEPLRLAVTHANSFKKGWG